MPDANWTIKKEISLGDAVAVIIAVISVVGSYFSLKGQIDTVELRLTLQEKATDVLKNDINERLKNIDDKLQRLIEREANQHGDQRRNHIQPQ